MTKHEDDGIIQVLKFLRDQNGSPTTINQIQKQFPGNKEVRSYLGMLRPQKETVFIKKAYAEPNHEQYLISEQGLFKIFDYEQLQLTRKISETALKSAEEAEKSAKSASKTALWAIGIGAIVGIIQIIFAIVSQ